VKGRGNCDKDWCPVTHNGVELFARRSHLDVERPTTGPVLTERTLRKGDEGSDVKIVQEALTKKGATIKVDGKFGSGTEAAVKDFQRRNGLDADGAVGPQTRQKLVG
jgi:peptidoglycan hydrolase-like protein with peptidoglycan-binding domain